MDPKLKLVTFATPEFKRNAQALCDSALESGFDDAVLFDHDDIRGSEFYSKNTAILEQERGGGYWLWKPYLIQQCLKSASPEEIIFYCDAGRTAYYQFTQKPTHLIDRVLSSAEGFVLGPSLPHLGTLRTWTKRDCLINLDADRDEILNKPLLMTWSLWRPSQAAFSFLASWLEACCDPRSLAGTPNTLGQPNYPEFRDHRHDQSIMSILAHMQNADYFDFSDTLIHKLLCMRPYSKLGQNLYKRPENADQIISGAGIMFLWSQYRVLNALA